jgi:hypothetical protein
LNANAPVFFVFVLSVVANVIVAPPASPGPPFPLSAISESSVRKTSAKPGAGTSMVHVCAVVSHCTVLMSRVPVGRPSDSKLPPNVCGLRFCQQIAYV